MNTRPLKSGAADGTLMTVPAAPPRRGRRRPRHTWQVAAVTCQISVHNRLSEDAQPQAAGRRPSSAFRDTPAPEPHSTQKDSTSMSKHTALPGFRDFYPEEMARRNQIFRVWKDVARRYGFEEYDGPPLESLELFIEKSGPEIVDQLFNFTDKGGREVALRPEMTPTLVRMLGAKIKGLPRPVRWFSTPQLFRYERQQRGRLREHFQLNMDIIGEESVLADADLLAAALDVLRSLGLGPDDIVARYSDRRLLQHALMEIGVSEENLPVAYNVIDKVERDLREVGIKRLGELGLSPEKAEAALDLTTLGIDGIAGRIGSGPQAAQILADLRTYQTTLEALGFGDYIKFDMKIVRGLAYYTGIVFEIFDRRGQLRAICGGGRYDKLFQSLAGVEVPSLGFGFGDVVLGELLKDRQLSKKYSREVDVCVVAGAPGLARTVLEVVRQLRSAGRSVIFNYRAVAEESADLGKQLKVAVTSGARHALIVGDSAAGRIRVKDLASGQQDETTLVEYLQQSSGNNR
jgi:histidyl-tRNA synthetase